VLPAGGSALKDPKTDLRVLLLMIHDRYVPIRLTNPGIISYHATITKF
jgi:hypothetical protein